MHKSICCSSGFFGLDFLLQLLDTSSDSCLCLSQRESSLVMVQTVSVTGKIMHFLVDFSELTPQQQLLSSESCYILPSKVLCLQTLPQLLTHILTLFGPGKLKVSTEARNCIRSVRSYLANALVIGKQEIRPKGVLSKTQDIRKDSNRSKVSALA